MNIFPCYTHIINPRLKNIYLGFDEHGELVVKSPKVSIEKIEKLIISKSAWINKTKSKLKNKKGRMNDLDNINLYYLGESFPLEFTTKQCKPILEYDATKGFKMYAPTKDSETITLLTNKFYLKQSSLYITPEVEKHSNIMGLYPRGIKYRKTKRQWGSCSGTNALSFNTMLMKLSPEVIRYVIIHELAHITHKNHQSQFWELVEKYCPNHKKLRQELKEYA